MVLGLTRADFKNTGLNTLYVLGHFAGGGVVAGVINTVALRAFNARKEKESVTANLLLLGSIAVGIGVCAHFVSRSHLVMITVEKVTTLVVAHLVAMVVSKLFSEKSWLIFLPTFCGSVSGIAGNRTLYTAATVGSMLGAGRVLNSYCNP